jgi:hypothetical protein
MSSYGGGMDMQGSNMGTPMSSADSDSGASSASMGMDGGSDADNAAAPTPVTEDTVAPSMPSYSYSPMESAPSAPSDESAVSAPSMPDIMPIAAPTSEAESADAFEAVPVAEETAASAPTSIDNTQADTSAAAPSIAASGSTGNAWANEALDHFNVAQKAISSGDWGGFGQAMNSLKTALESAAAGAGAGAMAAPAMAASSMSAPSPAPAVAAPSSADSGPWGGGASDNGSGAESYTNYNSSVAQPYSDSGSIGMAAAAGAAAAPQYSMPQEAQPMMPAPAASGGLAATDEEGVARLVVISTGAELSLPEQEEITVGREDPSSGIFPDVDLTPYGGEDGGVSRRHARLLHIGDDYFVEDLQSTNYTKLDGQRLPAHVRERLEDGARLDFGRVAVIFRRS